MFLAEIIIVVVVLVAVAVAMTMTTMSWRVFRVETTGKMRNGEKKKKGSGNFVRTKTHYPRSRARTTPTEGDANFIGTQG